MSQIFVCFPVFFLPKLFIYLLMESKVCKEEIEVFKMRRELVSLPEQELLLNKKSNGARTNPHKAGVSHSLGCPTC